MRHRYAVGQTLDMLPAHRMYARETGPCEVMACLPHDRGPLLYRVKSLESGSLRVIEETDLTPSQSVRAAETTAETPFRIAITRR